MSGAPLFLERARPRFKTLSRPVFRAALRVIGALVFYAALAPLLAYGQDIPAGAGPSIAVPSVNDSDPLEELQRQREEEQRIRDLENLQRRSDPLLKGEGLDDEGLDDTDQEDIAQDKAPCVDIDTIRVSGAQRLEQSGALQAITDPYVPNCLSRDKIAAVMKEIDNAYVKKGLITSRVYIEKQDFTDKVLKLKVVEGIVEDIVFIDQNGKTEPKRRRQTAFPVEIGKVLQLRDFEQGLDQINRLQSAKAQMKLAPGEQAGGSIVNITVEDKHRLRAFASLNNFGSAVTGENQLTLGVAGENLLVANDIWGLSYNGTLESNALSLSGSLPLGYATFDVNVSASDFAILLSPTSELFGDTITAGGSVNYVIRRDSNTKTFISAGLNFRQGRRFINAVALDPQTLTTARFTLRHVVDTKRAKYSFDGSYARGLDWFGALEDDPDNDGDPEAQFDLFELGVNRIARPQKWGRWTIAARGFASNDRLFGPQQTPLGSRSTIRGFRSSAISADIGAYARLDVLPAIPDAVKGWAGNLPGPSAGMAQKLVKSTQPYVHLDGGIGRDYARGLTAAVGGVGAGLRFNTKHFNVSVGGEFPIAKDVFRENNAPRFLASIGVNWP